jgi:hypothetical protein
MVVVLECWNALVAVFLFTEFQSASKRGAGGGLRALRISRTTGGIGGLTLLLNIGVWLLRHLDWVHSLSGSWGLQLGHHLSSVLCALSLGLPLFVVANGALLHHRRLIVPPSYSVSGLLCIAFAVWSSLDDRETAALSGPALEALLILGSFSFACFCDIRRTVPLSLHQYFAILATCAYRSLVWLPVLLIAISAALLLVVTPLDALGVPHGVLSPPIYFAAIYGPPSLIFGMAKHAAPRWETLLPS